MIVRDESSDRLSILVVPEELANGTLGVIVWEESSNKLLDLVILEELATLNVVAREESYNGKFAVVVRKESSSRLLDLIVPEEFANGILNVVGWDESSGGLLDVVVPEELEKGSSDVRLNRFFIRLKNGDRQDEDIVARVEITTLADSVSQVSSDTRGNSKADVKK